MMLANLVFPYTGKPRYLRVDCMSSKSMFPIRSASEETVITRLGALSLSRSSNKLVSRNGARWFMARVVSMPSAVSVRLLCTSPALLTSTSSLSCRPRNSSASLLTSPCSDRSASISSTDSLWLCSLISSRAASPRSGLRPTITTFAPIAANATAEALPMPEVPPVMSTVLPPIPPFGLSKISPALKNARQPRVYPATPARLCERRHVLRARDLRLRQVEGRVFVDHPDPLFAIRGPHGLRRNGRVVLATPAYRKFGGFARVPQDVPPLDRSMPGRSASWLFSNVCQ